MRDRRVVLRPFLSLAAVVFGLLCCGCTSLGLEDFNFFDSSPDYEIPQRISDVWTDAVLHQRGYPGVRGFGGRIMFHAPGDRPVRVDGTLTVYAYDESGGNAECEVPDRKYVFPADRLQEHHSPSDLGPSYSVWIPWGEVGGLERRITLIPRLEARNGQVVLGQPSTHVLPGRPPDPSRPAARGQASDSDGAVRQASHEATAEEPVASPAKRPDITAATIPVPPSFARQVFADPNFQAVARPGLTMGEGEVAPAFPMPGHRNEAAAVGPLPNAAVTVPPDYRQERLSVPPAARPDPWPPQAAAAVSDASPPTGSQPPRFPAQRAPAVQPRSSHVRTTPIPATWPSRLPMTPRSGGLGLPQTSTADDPSANWPVAEPDFY